MRFLTIASALALPLCIFGHPSQKTKGLNRRRVDMSSYRLQGGGEYSSSRTSAERDLIFQRDGGDDYLQTAKDVVKDIAADAKYRIVDDHYVGTNGVAHVNFRQRAHDMDIDNSNINVNIDKNGKVLSYGNSFYTGKIPEVNPLDKPEYSDPVSALQTAAKMLGIELSPDDVIKEGKDGVESYTFKNVNGVLTDPTADLVYFALPNNTLSLVWKVETDMESNWYLTYVDAKTGGLIQAIIDYVADAKYEVYPWGLNDPTEGSREILEDPWDKETSEFTWQGDGDQKYKTLHGNNAIAQANPSGGADYLWNYRPNSSSLEFVYPYPNGNGSRPSSYIDASLTQLFYTANKYHDLLYQLGFDEKAGNFETNNNGDGGKGNDYVILNAQDGSGIDNANFATPPDGKPGRMRMFLWTGAKAARDGALEAGIVLHEYTHGLSNRLTGGPANSGCLQTLEAAGMGEGWSDFYATAIRLKREDTRKTDYTMGAWASGDTRGIRAFPYSTSMMTNPLTYIRVNNLTMVHDIGTVWASMLNEVMWNLIDKHGKSDKHTPEFKDDVPTDGKFLSMKIVLDGLALQPCNPDFLSAREAILDADRALTGGDNQCEIWKGFAKRGLGEFAAHNGALRTNSFVVPKDVC